jgi:putative flippase GtrA
LSAVLRGKPATPAARPLRFVLVGVLGFLVDAGVLHALAAAGMPLLAARVISFTLAATSTWLANRTATFHDRVHSRGGLTSEWLRYMLASSIGGAVNYGAFALAVETSAAVARWPTVGVAIGSLAGMIVNYLLYSVYVFKKDR